ncbi:MAG TPA: aminoglycoside 6'-N-acetyltransferase, partial [Gammaproteobacteria bacterium]|nr:aminoglycoside 6'-N-acetyltransferase [Gammaproteobacteria bacterium]
PMIQIHPATPSDRTAWLAMRCALWPEGSAAEHAAEIEQFFAGETHLLLAVLLAFDAAGAAIGFAELSIRSVVDACETDRVAYLEGWYVEPAARHRGVGRALVRAAEDWGRAQGCTEFGSDTQVSNTVSAAAHAALGFTETDQVRCFKKRL